jgi:serine/threonine protein kinase
VLTTNIGTMRWSSPEVLGRARYGLKTDVYSFAIVGLSSSSSSSSSSPPSSSSFPPSSFFSLCFYASFPLAQVMWEIETRRTPFEELSHAFDVRKAILGGERPVIPSETRPEIAALMQRCWASASEQRPSFTEIVALLEAINSKS